MGILGTGWDPWEDIKGYADEIEIGGWAPFKETNDWASDFLHNPWEQIKETGEYFIEESKDPFGLTTWAEDKWGEVSGGDSVYAQTRRLAALNAQFIGTEGSEQARRQQAQYDDLRKQVIGTQASSGFLASGKSSKMYVDKMDSAFQSEMDYLDKSTKSRMEIAVLEGEVQAEIGKNQATAGGVGIATDVIGLFI